jgi:hypothetical protein
VKLVEALMLPVVGSVTAGDPALLMVVVSDPRLETETLYVPGSALDEAEAEIEVGSDDTACTLVAADPMVWIAVCRELNVVDRLFSDDCWAVSVCTSLVSPCSGSEAMATARVSTCWKSLANLLCP